MVKKKIALLALFIGSISLAALVFFVQQSDNRGENTDETPVMLEEKKNIAEPREKSAAKPFITRKIGSIERISYTIADAITDTLRAVQTSGAENNNPPNSSTSSSLTPSHTGQPPTIISIADSDPLFSVFWPPYYMTYLETMKSAAVQLGAKENVRALTFRSSEVIYAFLTSFLELLRKEGVVNENSYEDLHQGLTQSFPEGQNSELEALYKQTRAPRQQHVFSTAQAQGTVPGAGDIAVSAGGDCYQDPHPGNTSPGVNLWAPCCDCTTCDGGAQPPPEPPDGDDNNGAPTGAGGVDCGQTDRPLFCGCSENTDCKSGNCIQGICLAPCAGANCLEIPRADPPSDCSPEDPSCLEIPPVTLREKIREYISGITSKLFSLRVPEETQAQECIPIGCLNAVCPNGNAIWDPATGICGCDA